VRLERDVQLLIPAYDYCIPCKECTSNSGEEDPCELFSKVQFPVEEFFPANNSSGDNSSDCCCSGS